MASPEDWDAPACLQGLLFLGVLGGLYGEVKIGFCLTTRKKSLKQLESRKESADPAGTIIDYANRQEDPAVSMRRAAMWNEKAR